MEDNQIKKGWEEKEIEKLCDMYREHGNYPLRQTTGNFEEAMIAFIKEAEQRIMEEWREKVQEIHTELHNGRTESAYALLCRLLLDTKED